jgi:glucosyl-3-phosphoglycerate synthase
MSSTGHSTLNSRAAIEATSLPAVAGSLEEWFERRSYDHTEFADFGALVRKKRERGISLSVVLPAREVAGTIGEIVDEVRGTDLVDQLLVIDAGSRDGSAEIASRHGAEVYQEDELVPQFGPALGKGDAMWRALSVARGDVVMYLDSDTTDFGAHFVNGLLGPLLDSPELCFVKAAYSRPSRNGDSVEMEGSGRVTELTARPLFNLFYPELTGFVQPLAGELAAHRDLLCSIPYFTGYAVETAMLIDVLEAAGLDAMAQVDLGTRTNRNQGLFALSRMSFEVLLALEARLLMDGRLREPAGTDGYIQAIRSNASLNLDRAEVAVVERPPMAELG